MAESTAIIVFTHLLSCCLCNSRVYTYAYGEAIAGVCLRKGVETCPFQDGNEFNPNPMEANSRMLALSTVLPKNQGSMKPSRNNFQPSSS